MSWAQFKKRYAELEAYLGKDNEGIRRLKLIKDEANNLRTDLAAAKDETQLAQTIKDAARERADAAETAMEEMRIHSKSQDLKIQSMSQRVETLSKAISDLSREEEEDAAVSDLAPDVRIVVKALRKRLRFCPEAVGSTGHNDQRVSVYDRDVIAPGWSHDSIWTLGAFIAVLSSVVGHVAIRSSDRIGDLLSAGDKSSLGRHMGEWLRRRNNGLAAYAGDTTTEKLQDAATFSNQVKYKGELM